MDSGDSNRTAWNYSMSLNCTLKNGKFYVIYILYFITIKNKLNEILGSLNE